MKRKMKIGVGKLKAPRAMQCSRRNLFFTGGKILAYGIDGKPDNLA
jgi:hypothetical protein